MKITVFDSVSDPYGSSRMCRLMMQIMREAGHQVDAYVCIERLPAGQRYAKSYNFPLLVMTYLREAPLSYICNFLQSMRLLKKSLRELLTCTDLVYCNTLSTLPVAWCCKRLGIQTVLHLHETAPSIIVGLIGRMLLPWAAHRVVCVSAAVARSWRMEHHFCTRVIHNGIPDLSHAVQLETSSARSYDLCFVGRLTEKKGIGFLLAALKTLSCTHPPRFERRLRVAIAGGTLPGKSIPPELQQASSWENLEITYLGEITDASEVFLQSKVACAPSLFSDPFPTVVLEALRSGCSVIASELGGAREAMAGARGNLVPPGDEQALIESIVKQISGWRPECVQHNRQVFTEQFTFEQFRARLLALDLLQTCPCR